MKKQQALLLMVLNLFALQCKQEEAEVFPSSFEFHIDNKKYVYESKAIMGREHINSHENDSVLIISVFQGKDSVIRYIQMLMVNIHGLGRWNTNESKLFKKELLKPGMFYAGVDELDDDAIIGTYQPEPNLFSLTLTEIDTDQRVVSGRFEGVFRVEENYKTGSLRRFRQFPDSFEVKDGRFRVKYEDFINK
jgi:hypothetical protein